MQFGQNNTAFDKAEFAARLARTKARMAAADLEALIVCDPANMNYLTGYDGWSFYVHQCVVVAQDLRWPIWIGRGQDVNGAKLTTVLPESHVVGYADDHVQSAKKHPMQVVARVLSDHGLAAAIQAAGARGTEEFGGDYPAIVPLMPSGVGTSCPHITWLDEPFSAETGTSIEIAGVRRRYHVPMTRTVFLGTPPEKMQHAA